MTPFVEDKFSTDSGGQEGGDNLRVGASLHNNEEGHQQGGGSHQTAAVYCKRVERNFYKP